MSVRLGYAFGQGWSIAAAFGAILDGSLSVGERQLSFEPGFVGTLQAGVILMEADGALPFIESTLNLSASLGSLEEASGERQGWTALDLRLGVTTGWRIAEVWFPYIAIRVFGGPVFWSDGGSERTGSDSHHFQLALGSSVSFHGVDLFVDWGLPIGETSLAGGLGFHF